MKKNSFCHAGIGQEQKASTSSEEILGRRAVAAMAGIIGLDFSDPLE